MSQIAGPAAGEPAIDAEALKKAEEYIEAEEGASNKLRGWLGAFVTVVAVVMSVFHLYPAYAIVPTQVLRPVHVGFVLFLSYLLFPVAKRYRHRIMWWDWAAAFAAVAVIAYILQGGDEIWDRNTSPDNWDIAFGIALIFLILEGMRRASGWVMPIVVASFALYALFGEQLPGSWAHRSYEVGRLVGHLYMTLEGIFGVAVDVSSSLIILFTIYGAFLQFSGAGKFFIDFSFSAMGGKSTSAGRTVVLASFLLGGPSGSGVGDHRDAGLGRLPDAREGGLWEKRGGRAACGGGIGRDHLASGARRGGFPHRRVPEDLVSRRALDGDDPDLALLLRALPHGRDRRAQVRHEHGEVRAGRIAVEPDEELLVPLPVAGVDRRIHAHGIFARAVGVLGHGVLFCNELFAPRLRFVLLRPVPRTRAPGEGNFRVEILQGARGGLDRGAQRRHHLRGRRDHRRRGDAHGPGTQVQLDHHRLRGGLAPAHRDLHFAHRLDRRPRGAGDRVLHHLRGDRGAGTDQARGAGFRRAHVHLLLRGALRGVAADRAFAVCRGGDHWRRSVQDHAAVLEVHPARVPRALHVRARPFRCRAAAHRFDQDPRKRGLGLDRSRDRHRRAGHRLARGRSTGLAVRAHDVDRTGDVDRRGAGAGVPDHDG